MMISEYHSFIHWIANTLGFPLSGDAPMMLHMVLHIVLIWTPILLAGYFLYRILNAKRSTPEVTEKPASVEHLPPIITHSQFDRGLVRYILSNTGKQQVYLVGLGLLAMPILYATLELPKLIINEAMDAEWEHEMFINVDMTPLEHLLFLCALYLLAIILNGLVKFTLNLMKGYVGERLLRQVRTTVYELWAKGRGRGKRSEVIPTITQEVEPIGGYSAEMIALPVFQGGTFLTILAFMFIQDLVLGLAALTLLPVQLYIIPKLQKKLNTQVRERIAAVRLMGGDLGDQANRTDLTSQDRQDIGLHLKKIEKIRFGIYRTKFFIKALNNFLTALTPFFFFSIGGYLVLQGSLTLGALVAVLTAYKDFSSPLKELFAYYQFSEDVRIRFYELKKWLSIENSSTAETAIA